MGLGSLAVRREQAGAEFEPFKRTQLRCAASYSAA